MLTIRALSNGDGYAAHHLANNDYYAEGERIAGRWFGQGAARLGLAGEVKFADFEAVRQGLDPRTGEFLRERHGADRKAADGTVQSKARHLYDFTFSAPKSVSVLAELAEDPRLVEAHRRAVDVALRELEVHAAARVRKDLANEDRSTGNLIIAMYQHDTSRELDPQLHTHCVAANLTWDAAEQKWKALGAAGVYERRAYLSEVYRNVLAGEVLKLGYTIHARRDSKGDDAGFEITGVPKEVLEKFSRRSAQRDAAIAGFVHVHGRQPTDNEIATLVRETRGEKLIEITTPEVKRVQRSRMTADEARVLQGVRARASPVPLEVVRSGYSAEASLHHAEDHIFERVSVARDYAIFTEALRHGRGRINLSELQESLQAQEATRVAFRYKSDVATQASLERERAMVATINRGMAAHTALAGEFTASANLTDEQKHAIGFVLASRDFAVNLRGAAGTGKTRALEKLHRGLVENGREVLAVAPSVSAVEELQKVGFRGAITITRLLENPEVQFESRGRVVILDEAGMVSGREMAQFLAIAERNSMRVVFCGDTKQLRSVEAGDALRILEHDSMLKSTSLTRVQRQTVQEYREAIQELRRNPRRGFDRLVGMGAVQKIHITERASLVQRAYSAEAAGLNSRGEQRTVLVVAATHDELGVVTRAIREHRKQAGELVGRVELDRHVPLNFTLSQKRDASSFSEGQLLIFHRRSKTIAKHQVLEVVRAEGENLVLRTSMGTLRMIKLAGQAQAFQVFERKAFELAPNDRILLMANRNEKAFHATNGELATVSRIEANGRIHLEDGRVLPANYRQIDHGYAITTHRSQGKTVDAVVISADAMRKELFYVAASRGRESVTVVTSDPDGLRESIAISGDRTSATDLRRLTDHHAHSARANRRARCRVHHNIWRPAVEYEFRKQFAKHRGQAYGI